MSLVDDLNIGRKEVNNGFNIFNDISNNFINYWWISNNKCINRSRILFTCCFKKNRYYIGETNEN